MCDTIKTEKMKYFHKNNGFVWLFSENFILLYRWNFKERIIIKIVKSSDVNVNEASRIIETLLMMKNEDAITIKQTREAIKNVPYYKDILNIDEKE